jgi:hypothetical protein
MCFVRSVFILCALAACGNGSAPSKDEPRADPWGAKDEPAADPWTSGSKSQASEPPSSTSASTILDGHYACQIPTYAYNSYTHTSNMTYVPAGFDFWLEGDRFRTRNANGTIVIANRIVNFQGGDIDGWRAAINTHTDGRNYLVFRKDRSADPQPGESTKFGDYYCAKQPS